MEEVIAEDLSKEDGQAFTRQIGTIHAQPVKGRDI